MKYLKTYKQSSSPQIGDYVIVDNTAVNKDLNVFLKNNIGQIINKKIIQKSYGNVNFYIIKYDNITKDVQGYFLRDTFDCTEKCIGYYSPNKEDVEVYLQTKKYNL